MTISKTGVVHFFLPGLSATPIGGYKVVYEYANHLVDQGIAVSIWHSSAFIPMSPGRARRMASLKRRVNDAVTHTRSGRAEVPWFILDERVNAYVTVNFPKPKVGADDVCVATAVQTTPYVSDLALAAGARSVAFIQHFEDWAASPDQILSAWARADERVVIAPWLAEKCASASLSSVTIPNAVESGRFPLGPALIDREPRVVSLLAPHAYKRPDVVMGALELAGELCPTLRLTTFGQAKRPPSLSEKIEYVRDPSHDQLVDLYQLARIYLCGSDAEGWHLPPAEATLCGAAVVSTDIGGVRVSMADDAIYASPGDVRGLAQAIVAVADDTVAAQLRVQRCRSRLIARTYESNAVELAKVLFA